MADRPNAHRHVINVLKKLCNTVTGDQLILGEINGQGSCYWAVLYMPGDPIRQSRLTLVTTGTAPDFGPVSRDFKLSRPGRFKNLVFDKLDLAVGWQRLVTVFTNTNREVFNATWMLDSFKATPFGTGL